MNECKMCKGSSELMPVPEIVGGLCEAHYDAVLEIINDERGDEYGELWRAIKAHTRNTNNFLCLLHRLQNKSSTSRQYNDRY